MLKDETSAIFLAVFAGDIIVVAKNIRTIDKVKNDLVKVFKMKHMEMISYCLGIEFK